MITTNNFPNLATPAPDGETRNLLTKEDLEGGVKKNIISSQNINGGSCQNIDI